MRISQKLAIGTILLSVAAWAGSTNSPTPYDPRPDDPYTVSATVEPAQGNTFIVRVSVTEKKTGNVVSSPAVQLQPGIQAESFSDHIAGKPEFHTRILVDQSGKASITFEAYEHVLQRSAVSAQSTR